jgi:predicted nucleic acid-binding protein
MRYLLDTSVIIDHLRGDALASRWLRTLAGDELWSVTPVRTEIWAGMRLAERAATMRFLDGLRWLDVSLAMADAAGVLANKYRKSHQGVDTIDYIIAAATQMLGAELCTLNLKHFPMFPRLEAPY